MPQISVIVPVYNVEKYIHRCVDSILNQTFTDFELILVDDGSPDNCGAVCEEYADKDSRIVVIHQENGGLSAARNSGIRKATGNYVMFVDADDVIHPDALNTLITCVRKTGAQIARARFDRFYEDSVPEDRLTSWNGVYAVRNNLETLDCFFEDAENLPSLVSACGKLWRRDLFDGIEFPVGRLFEDEFVTYKLYHRAEQIASCDAVLYFYYDNLNGITRNLTLEKRFDEYDAQWERLQYFGGQNLAVLQGKAAMWFLRTAQWDLMACRKNTEYGSTEKKRKLEIQYREAFGTAKAQKRLSFIKQYDYYVLAYPQYTFLWRVMRQAALRINRKV